MSFNYRLAIRQISANRFISTSVVFMVLSSVLAAEENISYFDTLVITASKTEQRLGDVAGTMAVINDEDIQTNIVDSVDDLFRFTPAVNAVNERADSISIRGMDGNRVLITVDGVKQPKEMDFGPLKSGRNFIDPNTLKQVEVVPGPASSLYGSDAMAGVVAYTTKEPGDILQEGKNFGGGTTFRYNGANEGVTKSARIAGRNGKVEGMLIVTGRDTEETDNNGEINTPGPTYEKPDPRDIKDGSLLGKINVDLSEAARLKLTAEQVKSEDELTQLRTTAAFSNYRDESEKNRFSAELEYDQPNAAFDNMSVKLDWQEAKTDSLWSYQFGPAPATYLGMYEEETQALNLAFDKVIQTGALEHKFSYGFSLEQQDYAQRKDSSSSGIDRSMPKSEQQSAAFYVQDQVKVNDKLTVTPGVRFDKYSVSPKPDADYLASSPVDADPADNEGSQTSLKLGATYSINNYHSLFGQFAQGYKAPDMDQLYTNSERPYLITLPNANLDPESSNSFEFGYRFEHDRGNAEIAVFHNDYKDFIEDVTISAPGAYPPTQQTQNLAGVQIQGVELKGSVNLNDNFLLRGALAYADGTYEKNGVETPLNSVSPLNGTLAVRYDANGKRWGSELAVTAARGKAKKDVDTEELGVEEAFLPGGYGVFDITAYYKLGKNARIDLGLFNIADKTYWDWDTINTGSGHGAALARTETGRHFKMGLNWDF